MQPTFEQCWRATNNHWQKMQWSGTGISWVEIPQENRIPATSSPFSPFVLQGEYHWKSGNEVELREKFGKTDGIIGLVVKPGFRVKMRIESNENNAFWGMNMPEIKEGNGGLISRGKTNWQGAYSDDWMEFAMTKGDFIYFSSGGEHSAIPQAIKELTSERKSTMIGINNWDAPFPDDSMWVGSADAVDDEIRIELLEIQTVEEEEGMWLGKGDWFQGEATNVDFETGEESGVEAHVSGLETQTHLVGQQNNFKVELLGEPVMTTSNTWTYYWYILVNGVRDEKYGPYDILDEAEIAGQEVWEGRPPPEDTITPKPEPMDWEGLVVAGLIILAVGFGIWFTIKAVTKRE